jgi:tripartite ATP-independent transporter DctM subunit
MTTFAIALGIAFLALLGTPLFIVISAIALVCFHSAGVDSQSMIIEIFGSKMGNNPNLMAIPMFTFAGFLLAHSKSPYRWVNLGQALFGWIPGGLSIAALISCAIFTAFNGASGVTIIALGGIILPLLLKEKYPERFSLGLLTTSGSLGLLFIPSLPLILYGIVAKVSINQLFAAGALPGIMIVIMLAVYSIISAHRNKVPTRPFVWSEVKKYTWEARYEMPFPVIILGGIYSGYFTVGDAAIVTAVWSIIMTTILYREVNILKDLPKVAQESMVLIGVVMIILAASVGFTNYLVDEMIPMKILAWMQVYIHSKLLFLIVLNIFLLIVGCLMDIYSALIVVVPLILPISEQFGVNPIHLGIIFLVNLEIGYNTPPVGLNLFIGSFRFGRSIQQLCRAVIPTTAILLLALLIITYVPEISLGMVRWLNIQ